VRFDARRRRLLPLGLDLLFPSAAEKEQGGATGRERWPQVLILRVKREWQIDGRPRGCIERPNYAKLFGFSRRCLRYFS